MHKMQSDNETMTLTQVHTQPQNHSHAHTLAQHPVTHPPTLSPTLFITHRHPTRRWLFPILHHHRWNCQHTPERRQRRPWLHRQLFAYITTDDVFPTFLPTYCGAFTTDAGTIIVPILVSENEYLVKTNSLHPQAMTHLPTRYLSTIKHMIPSHIIPIPNAHFITHTTIGRKIIRTMKKRKIMMMWQASMWLLTALTKGMKRWSYIFK